MSAGGMDRYVLGEIAYHLRHHFRPEVSAEWAKTRIVCGEIGEITGAHDALILVPRGLGATSEIDDVWRVPFHGTSLTLWNRVPKPSGWRAWPSDTTPLWYLADDGRAMPAWDLLGNLTRLLGLEEEIASTARDRHGRLPAAASPRSAAGLLEVPAFNEAAAALVDLLFSRAAGVPPGSAPLESLVLPVGMILSHDLDLLRGNDLVTQAIRAYRFVRPLLRGKAPDLRAARAIPENQRHPYRRYLERIPALVALEREAGARSSFYFLNGTGGRFGARSGTAEIPRAREQIPPDWGLGMHYNYDTLLEPRRFRRQRNELENLLGVPVAGGRAHYLRFDPRESFRFLDREGMRYDETVGYADRIGYRAGVAGAYHPPRRDAVTALTLVEIPLAIMDGALAAQYPGAGEKTVARLLDHLSRIGGSLSVLLHAENLDDPEDDGLPDYRKVLALAHERGARFLLPADFLDAT